MRKLVLIALFSGSALQSASIVEQVRKQPIQAAFAGCALYAVTKSLVQGEPKTAAKLGASYAGMLLISKSYEGSGVTSGGSTLFFSSSKIAAGLGLIGLGFYL